MPDDIDDGDLMLGAEPIARFLTQLFDGEQITPTDVYNWCSRGALPHSKLGAKLVGSKARIRQHFYAPALRPAPAFSARQR